MASTTPRAKPMVVVVGRPNVGKSSLINRIVGRRVAVVEEEPGVTRDRKVLDAEWNGLAFHIVDTGGWLAGGSALDQQVSKQSVKALDEADLVLFVVDVQTGVTAEDLEAARLVQRTKRPVILVANKVDDQRHEQLAWEFLQLGLGEAMLVSAQHGRGTCGGQQQQDRPCRQCRQIGQTLRAHGFRGHQHERRGAGQHDWNASFEVRCRPMHGAQMRQTYIMPDGGVQGCCIPGRVMGHGVR